MLLPEFEDIRPYNDNEINSALNRLTNYPQFKSVLQFLYPENEHSKIISLLNSIDTAADLQSKFMRNLVFGVVEKTSTAFTTSGLENLSPDMPYLFIANHRDIILDSAMLQAILNVNNFPTTEITFGSNLMSFPLIVDFGKANRMFKVNRGGNPREFLTNSKILSAYIRHTITEKKASVWIAQRNGRTKNGDDKTEIALLKMLNMSGTKSIKENFSELNIVPVTVSYEIEPCCLEKVNELYISSYQKYEKKPGEDISSILKGLTQNKGRIHLAFGKIINESIPDSLPSAETAKELSSVIDNVIYKNFKFWPANYIAYDMVLKTNKYSEKYSEKEKSDFTNYKVNIVSKISGDKTEIEKIFLNLYANPIINLEKISQI